MKLHLPNKLRAALLACFTFVATTVGSASADFVWIGEDNFTADVWNNPSNWELTDGTTYPAGGTGPATPNSNGWARLVFNGKSGTTPLLEGWEFKIDVTQGSTIATSVKKLQGGCSINVEQGSTLTLTLQGGGNDGGSVAVGLGGTFKMILNRDKGGEATTVNYGDIATASGVLNLSSSVEGTARNFNSLTVTASLTSTAVSDTTELHEYTLCTFTGDVNIQTFSSLITSVTFNNAGDVVLTADDANIGKYSVVKDDTAGTIKLYYVTGVIDTLTWNGGATGTWEVGSTSWLNEATYANGLNVVFNTADAAITVSGAIAAYKVSAMANTSFTLAEGASLSMAFLHIEEGATLTVGTMTSLVTGGATGTGDLVLTMSGDSSFNGNGIVSLPGSQFGSVTIAGGAFAVNLNGQEKSSDLGSSDLIMANDTTYVIRSGVGADAAVTSGDIKLQGTMNLQVYGSVSSTTLGNNIVKAAEGADTTIFKQDGGTVVLTGSVTADHLYVNGGTLKLGSGANATVSQVRLSENASGDNKLVVESGATLTVTGGNNNHNTSDSLILAHGGHIGLLEVNGGTLDAAGALALTNWQNSGSGTLSVNSGTAKLKGLNYWGYWDGSFRGALNLGTADGTGDAVLELGQEGIKHLNVSGANLAVLNLGNGTLKAVANTYIGRTNQHGQGNLNLIGTGTGTRFDTNGFNMTVGTDNRGNVVDNTSINVTGGGNMVKAGEGTLTINGNLETGFLSIEQGTLQLNGDTSVTRMIINDGTLAFGGNASLSITSLSGLESETGATTYSDPLGDKANGYANGSFTVIRSSSENGTTTVTGLTSVTIAGSEMELTESNGKRVITFDGASGCYFVNEGTLEYGAADNSMTADTTAGIILNGGNLTLGQALNDGVKVYVWRSAVLTVNEGVTVGPASLICDKTLGLSGSGGFELGNSLDLPDNIRLSAGWTGTVFVQNIAFNGDAGHVNNAAKLDKLANANSWVGLSGCTGWLASNSTIAANLLLQAGDAVKLTNGGSNSSLTFSGRVAGEGNFVISMSAGTGVNNVTCVFSGDVSGWTGKFDSSASITGRTFKLQFTGEGDIGTSILNGLGRTLDVTIGGTGNRTMNGSITNTVTDTATGTLNLTVQGGGAKTFAGNVEATTMTVAANTSVTLSGTTTIGTLNANRTIANTGALTISTALQETIADANTVLKVASEYSTLTHTDGSESTDGNGYMTAGYGYVIESTGGGTLSIADSLTLAENYKVEGNHLLYRLESAEPESIYYINTNTIYSSGADVANVESGKTILVGDGADLTLTGAITTSDIIFKTAGSGSVTLNRNATVSVGEANGLLSTAGTDIGRLNLASGTTLEITSSSQMAMVQRAKTIVVQDGATFSHRVTGGTIPAGVKFEICGAGSGAAGSGALVFCSNVTYEGECSIGGTVTLTGNATICSSDSAGGGRYGTLAGEVVGNGYTLTKTGTNELRFDAGSIGADKRLDAALHIQQGVVRLNFSNVNMATAGAESRKIAGKVTLESGTTLNIYDGYTELTGGLKVNGAATLNATWAKGVSISSLVEGGVDAVLHIKRDGKVSGDARNTLVLGVDNSSTFAGTWQVEEDWMLRADNTNALGNATLNLNHASAVLEYGQGVEAVSLAGLGGVAGATVNGGGSGKLTLTGGGDYNYAGTLSGVQTIVKRGSGTQTLAGVAEGTDITVSGGTLTVTEVVSAGDVTLGNGATLAANVTLGGTLSGAGSINGDLTSTAGSAIALNLAGVQAGGDALITATRADVSAGRFGLNLSGLTDLGNGLYSLLQWEGIALDQFDREELTGNMELVVSNGMLCLRIGNADLYWKGSNNTWDASESDWVTDSASTDMVAYTPGSTVHFVDGLSTNHDITVQGSQTAFAIEVQGGTWSFDATGADDSLSIGNGGITINADSVTLKGSITSAGAVKMVKENSALVVAEGTELSVNGLKLDGTTVTHTGSTEDVLSITSDKFSVAGGTLTNTTAGDVTVGMVIAGNGVGLVQSGGGTLTLGGTHTLGSLTTTSGSVALTGATTVGGTALTGSTVTTGGEAFSLGSTNTTVNGGSVTTSDTTVNAALTDVALTTTNADGTTVISGTQNLASLTNGGATTIAAGADVTVGGNVQLKANEALTVNGTLANDNLVISGGSSITADADKQLSLWNHGSTTGQTIAGGSISDDNNDRDVYATLNNVDYTFNGGGTLKLIGTQSVGTLTVTAGGDGKVEVTGTTTVTNLAQCNNMQVNAGASLTAAGAVSGTLTNNGGVTASGDLTVGTLANNAAIDMGTHNLTLNSATAQGGTISNAGSVTLAGDSNAFTAIGADTVTGSGSISVSGDSSIGSLNGVTEVTVTGESANLSIGTADGALTLSGTGKLTYGTDGTGALTLASGASDIGSLKAGSLSLTGTSTLAVGSLELTDGLISLSDLTGMTAGDKLVTAGGITLGAAQTALKVDITAATIDSIAGKFVNSSLTLAQLTGLTGVTFADGTTTVSSGMYDREYSITVDAATGNVILTYSATGNSWVSTDGVWDGTGDDFANGDPNGVADGQAAFLGDGTSTVTVSGDKTIKLLTVDVNAGSDVDTYTFTGDSITAETGLVACGTMVVENTIRFTGSLTVQETPTVGHLSIGTTGTVTVDGAATGAIVNNGVLSVGGGSNITLGGAGALTTSGNVTVAMAADASVSTLTVGDGSSLALTTGATVGTLANQGTVTVAGDLTLTQATAQGGDVQANNLTLADGTDNTFGTLSVTGTVTNTGTLTVGDGTSIGTLAGNGALTVSGGAVTLKSDTSISTLTNQGTVTVEGGLTLTEATAQGGNVQANNLTLADGTDNTFGTLSVTGTVTNTGTLTVGDGTSIGTLAGNGALTTAGDVTVTTAVGASVSTLTVGDGTATFTTDTTVGKLAGSGSLVVQGADSTLALDGTEAACTVNVTAGTLNLTGSTGALSLGELSLDTIVFDSDNPGTADTPLVTATGIVSGIIFEQDLASGLLAAGDYTLLGLTDGGTANLDTIGLSNATLSAYQTGGYAVKLEVVGSDVRLVVVEDNARTWNTSGNTLEDTLGNTVQNPDGSPLELALGGENVYKSLDGVTYVHADGDTTIDLTDASPDSATDPGRGLVVSNLSGDGGHTLSIEGDGDDRVTLATQQGFTPEQTANLSLSGLDATMEGDLSLKGLAMEKSSLDANGNTLTVENLSGDADSKLSGTVIVTGSNSFLGTYGGNTSVELTEGSGQTLNAADGLTVTGSGGTANLVVTEGSSITAIQTTGTNVTFSNGGVNTLELTETSTMEGGTLALEVSLKKVSDHLQGAEAYSATTKSALKLTGVTIEVTMTDTDKVSELSTSSTDADIILFRISDHADSTIDACTLTIHDRALLDKYFSDIRLVQGSINVVGTRRTDYYGDKFTWLSANGTVGVDFAGLALSYVDPQNADKDGDLAKVLDALDNMAPGDSAAADELGAAFAGAGTAAMGVALAGDMDRQLRAIRNRTTTMGVSGDYVYDNMPAFNAWINAEGDYRTLDKDGTMAGYTLNSWGGTVGVDVDFSPHFTAGLAATAMYGDLKADSTETKAEGDMDTYYVSLFARYADKAWVHTFVASIGMSDLTMDRTVTCGGEGSYTASGDTTGVSFGLMYEAGYVIALDEEGTACLQPVANITYKHTSVDGYNESGSDAALEVDGQTLDSVTIGLGARFQAAVGETVYNRTSLLEMRALAKVEAGDRSSSADVALPGVPGATGTVESAEADAFGIELGAGITVPVGVDSGALFIDVSAELRGSYTNVNGTVGYRINF